MPPSKVSEVWPHARQLIRAAIDRGGISDFPDIERKTLNGEHLLWLAWDGSIVAAATTRLTDDACELVACGGSRMRDWLHFIVELEAYARAEGCKVFRVLGRRGWLRVLPGYVVKARGSTPKGVDFLTKSAEHVRGCQNPD